MGLDPLSVVAPARVRALVLPIGRITASKFLDSVDRLQQENVIRLGDVSPDGRPHRSMALLDSCIHDILILTRHTRQQCSRR